MSRLQNRVLLLQREVEELRGPSGRGHLEPTVPEKQFQQLSTSHGKAGDCWVSHERVISACVARNLLPTQYTFAPPKNVGPEQRSPTTCRPCGLSCRPPLCWEGERKKGATHGHATNALREMPPGRQYPQQRRVALSDVHTSGVHKVLKLLRPGVCRSFFCWHNRTEL